MYFVQDNETDISYDNSTVQAVLDKWKCTDELSCICCPTCAEGQPQPPGGRRKRSPQDDGPPDEPKPLTCSSTPIVCTSAGSPAGSPGSPPASPPARPSGPRGGRSKRSLRNLTPLLDRRAESDDPLQPSDGGPPDAPQPPDGGQPGEYGGNPDNDAPPPPPETDPDFKRNAEFLQLLMRLDENTRERIGHK